MRVSRSARDRRSQYILFNSQICQGSKNSLKQESEMSRINVCVFAFPEGECMWIIYDSLGPGGCGMVLWNPAPWPLKARSGLSRRQTRSQKQESPSGVGAWAVNNTESHQSDCEPKQSRFIQAIHNDGYLTALPQRGLASSSHRYTNPTFRAYQGLRRAE